MRKYLPLIIILGLIAIVFFWGVGVNNSLVTSDQTVKKAWADVEADYQRRSDLIPNIVNTVKGEANFEQSTLKAVIEARASATQTKIDPSNITPDKLAEFQRAQDGLSSAIGRLLVVTENYPNLKANQAFADLRAELEGTENRISVSRKRFNEAVQEFNSYLLRFPGSTIGRMLGFTEKGYFKAAEGSDKAPEVKF